MLPSRYSDDAFGHQRHTDFVAVPRSTWSLSLLAIFTSPRCGNCQCLSLPSNSCLCYRTNEAAVTRPYPVFATNTNYLPFPIAFDFLCLCDIVIVPLSPNHSARRKASASVLQTSTSSTSGKRQWNPFSMAFDSASLFGSCYNLPSPGATARKRDTAFSSLSFNQLRSWNVSIESFLDINF
jgi:hypothetical protein